MVNLSLVSLILAIAAILLSGAAFVALWSRIIADESRINESLSGRADIVRLDDEQKKLYQDVSKNRADMISMNESLASISAKWAARIKSEEARERRTLEREEAAAATAAAQGAELEVIDPPAAENGRLPAGNSNRVFLRAKKTMFLKKTGG